MSSKPCDHCRLHFSGFGTTCARCRKGQNHCAKQCPQCKGFFLGATPKCPECLGMPATTTHGAAGTPSTTKGAAAQCSPPRTGRRGPAGTISSTESLEGDVTQWLEAVSGQQKSPFTSFGKWLADGQLLCKVANRLSPGIVPHINTSKEPFKKMENITAFINACRKLGVNEKDVFSTVDLAEQKDLLTVMRCIESLGRVARETCPGFQGPYLGAGREVHVKDDGKRQQMAHGDVAAGGLLRDVTNDARGAVWHARHM